jgi:hypothetical protein
MIGIEDVLVWSLAQKGDTYMFGAPFNRGDLNPTEFDCSGLVEWSCRHAGVDPPMPTGSWIQATHCHKRGTDATIDEAVKTRGALLFRFNADPFTSATRPSIAHVAFSLGDGTTMEAASKKVGVGVLMADPVKRGWTHAALIPGVDYAPTPTASVRTAGTGVAPTQEDDDDMVNVIWYEGPDGSGQPYAVSGVTGKFLDEDALNVYLFFHHPVQGKSDAPLGASFSKGVALLDGPCKNV